jgi:hypothetical protein
MQFACHSERSQPGSNKPLEIEGKAFRWEEPWESKITGKVTRIVNRLKKCTIQATLHFHGIKDGEPDNFAFTGIVSRVLELITVTRLTPFYDRCHE